MRDKSALEINSGEELEHFDLGTITINGTVYNILTGFETSDKCWWCGNILEKKRRSKHFCNSHRQEYNRHFEWGMASNWCRRRAKNRCELCGIEAHKIPNVGNGYGMGTSGYRVHHIVPVNGGERYYTAYNLPWNLIALCHSCHMDVHRVMKRTEQKQQKPNYTSWELARQKGQAIMELI